MKTNDIIAYCFIAIFAGIGGTIYYLNSHAPDDISHEYTLCDAIIKHINDKEFDKLNALQSTSSLTRASDTFTKYSSPEVSLIPKQADGSFGSFHKPNFTLYYMAVKDNGIPKDTIAFTVESSFEDSSLKYQLIGFSEVKNQ